MQKETLISFETAYKKLQERFKSLSCYGCPKISIVKYIKDNYTIKKIDGLEFLSTNVFRRITKDLENLFNRV